LRFAGKIGLVLVVVGVLPVALLGLASYTVSRDELQRTVGRMQTAAAEDLALFTERFVTRAVESVRLSAGVVKVEQLARSELSQIVNLPYQQLPFVSIVALVDDRNRPVAGPVFDRNPTREGDLAGREPVSNEDLDRFARAIPAAPASRGATAVSRPYRGASGPARIAVSMRLGPDRTMALEISLREVEERVVELSQGGDVAYLVDDRGDLVVHGVPGARLASDERRLSDVGFAKGIAWSHLLYRDDGVRWLAAFAPVRRLGWGAVVAQPMAVAFGAAERLRSYTFGVSAIALLVAIAVGALLARRVTRPVARLSRAAAAIEGGDYGAPVEVRGGDELADLGRVFNRMIAEVKRRDDEIRGWNAQLQKRVAERTAELKTAQDQILRTRRLAALGSLGAGLAHELNNPMTAITGYLTILKKSVADGSAQAEMIARALDQAHRVARVVEDLRSFADQERGTSGQRFSLASSVRAALALYEGRLRAAGIALTTRIDPGLPDAQGDAVQIQQVVAHLVENAINAMPRGGALEVTLGTVDGEALRLRVVDTGRGIPQGIRDRIFDPFFTTKEGPNQVGLGLSVSHSIVEAHHGRIVVESQEGAGAAVTVLLPAATSAHLA
jgi:two-component system NtrC family sensor kinase